jgi:hypothetical protein
MDKAVGQSVRDRAGGVCEYCHVPQSAYRERFQIDHIIPRQHGGAADFDNLALSCLECNRRKGPNLTGIDPVSRVITRLFDPLRDRWNEHFVWSGPRLVGTSSIGRTTAMVLDVNRPLRVIVRATIMSEGTFPPKEDRNDNVV